MKYREYKGYTGSIEYSPEDGLLYGKAWGSGASFLKKVKPENYWKEIFGKLSTVT